MRQKKLFVGMAAAALVLCTATASYAAEPDRAALSGKTQHLEDIALDGGDDILPLDENSLPEGVQFAEEISQGGDNETMPFDESSLPKDVQFTEDTLPEGVQFAEKIEIAGDNSVKYE